jgi:hypothetical protein
MIGGEYGRKSMSWSQRDQISQVWPIRARFLAR